MSKQSINGETMTNQPNPNGASMKDLFNPVRNPIVLMSEFGLVLYQQGHEFILVSVEGDKFYDDIERAFNDYCRFSSDSDLVFDDVSASEDPVIGSYVEAFDTSGQALDWDEVNRDIFGNEVDFNDQRA